jgi:hypothetical protein
MASKIKRNTISENLWDYNVGLLGESGIGKTTTMCKACELLVGTEGYVVLNMGKEDGVSCLEDVPYIDIPDWKVFDEVTKDFIDNKTTDYSTIKIILIDTLDQLFEITEPEVIRRWNTENRNKKDYQPVKTLNASWGGFGRGEDKTIEIILNRLWELKKVGYAVWFCGHTKTRDIVDPITNETYNTLTTNMMQKYFNGIKSKFHLIGIACIDRAIAKEKTGRKNIVNKQDITVNRIKSETRKIVFRDDNYSVDSKSRFAGIVNEIPLDAEVFIKAMQDAIAKEKAKKKKLPVPDDIELGIVEEVIPDNVSKEEDLPFYPDNLAKKVKEKFKECTNSDIREKVKNIIKEYGKFSDVDTAGLRKIYDIL